MALSPITYPPVPDKAVASYDYEDIAAGTGMKLFYGAVSKDPTIGRMLLEIPLHSASREFSLTGGATTLDFNLSAFNLPRTIKGTALVSACMYCDNSGTQITLGAQIKKVSGVTVTNTSAVVTSEVLNTSGVGKMILLEIPVTTAVHYKKGDILRLTVFITPGAPGANIVAFAHSPMGLPGETYITAAVIAAGNLSTVFKFLCPFRIDL